MKKKQIKSCYMDDNIVAVSPSTVYRILAAAHFLDKRKNKETKKGKRFIGPTRLHEHWHVDITYLNNGAQSNTNGKGVWGLAPIIGSF